MARFVFDDEQPKQRFVFDGEEQPAETPQQPESRSWVDMLKDEAMASIPGRFLKGAKDITDAGAQMITRALPESLVSAIGPTAEEIDRDISNAEAEYQAARARTGSTGVDLARAGGNIAASYPLISAIPGGAAKGLLPRMLQGSAAGTVAATMQPVDTTKGDFGEQKASQAKIGAVFGGLSPAVLGAVSRLVSPKASTDATLQALRGEGIKPTIGQALGGKFATAEEKLTSLPIMGDMIHRARGQTLQTFNNAAINRAVGQIGKKVEGAGHEAVKKAGDLLSKEYDDALSHIKGVKFDARFDMELENLKRMAQSLVPSMRNKFDKAVQDVLEHRMSPNRSMLADVYKRVDSEIGKISSRYGKSTVASEQELGDALAELQRMLKEQMMRSNPQAAARIKAADRGWANLVRIEQAAKSAKNAEGIFTPAQLNAAIQQADDSVRGRAVSRGTALMQKFGSRAQTVLGSKYPDSGTAGRLALGLGSLGAGGGAVGAGFIEPTTAAVTAGMLGTGGLAYTRPVQNALVKMLTERPEMAEPLALAIRRLGPASAVAAPALLSQ